MGREPEWHFIHNTKGLNFGSNLREHERPESQLGAMRDGRTQTGKATYNSGLAYELISQFKLTSSNCGVVHSIPSLVSFDQRSRIEISNCGASKTSQRYKTLWP